jgi:hypothetical protein
LTLPISSTIIRNAIGYLSMEITALNNYLDTIDNPNSTQTDKDNAELEVKQFAKNIGKMCRTIEERTNWTMPATGYTNQQLTSKGII